MCAQDSGDKQLGNVLRESPRGIAGLLRTAAHPARIQILTLLLQGERGFSRLMQTIGLSKTALSNHLDQLVDKRLVQRIGRGEYVLTVDGKELLKVAATVFENSAYRAHEGQELLSRRYHESMVEGQNVQRRKVGRTVEYVQCWLSYVGAMTAGLKSLGTSVDATDVGGFSGYAFLVNVSKSGTYPSGPTALTKETWHQIIRGTESLGWILERYRYPHFYPTKENYPTSAEIEAARKLFEKVKQEIDKRNQPVVVSGLFVPAYGVVSGYEGNNYVISKKGKPDELVPFYDLKAPQGLDAFFFRKRIDVNHVEADREALLRAFNLASANVPVQEGFVAGPEALERWAGILQGTFEGKQDYMGNSYVGLSVAEGHHICDEFLGRLAKRLQGIESGDLRAAAERYEKSAELMERFTRIFPFRYEGEMDSADRKRGAGILMEVKLLEEMAIRCMEKAIGGKVLEA